MIYAAIIMLVAVIGMFAFSFLLDEMGSVLRLVAVGGLLLTGVFFGITAATTVSPGHVGVPVLFGSVQNYTLPEGFHFINPFLSVDEMSIQTQNDTMIGETALHAMSSDQLSMTLDVTVLYHLNPDSASGIRRFMPTYNETVVRPSVRTAVRDAVREFNAVAAVSDSRDELGARMVLLVRERVANALEQRGLNTTSIHIDDVQLRNIELPAAIQESIAAVQRQQQLGNEREQSIRTARQEAQASVAEAEGAARVVIIQATRDAEARLIRSRADAEANGILDDSITPNILRLRAIDATRAITSSNNTRTVILGGGTNQQMPLIMNMGQ